MEKNLVTCIISLISRWNGAALLSFRCLLFIIPNQTFLEAPVNVCKEHNSERPCSTLLFSHHFYGYFICLKRTTIQHQLQFTMALLHHHVIIMFLQIKTRMLQIFCENPHWECLLVTLKDRHTNPSQHFSLSTTSPIQHLHWRDQHEIFER